MILSLITLEDTKDNWKFVPIFGKSDLLSKCAPLQLSVAAGGCGLLMGERNRPKAPVVEENRVCPHHHFRNKLTKILNSQKSLRNAHNYF